MSLLVVGSIALDSVATPFGETADAPGGSAVFFSAAGSILHPIQVVGVIGSDYPLGALKKLEARGVKFDVPYRQVPAIGLNIAYITDPSGVYIELTEGYDKY